jgi:TonB family protein
MQKDLDNLFYTEGYNATSASLAQFARSLFPEDWVQEAGGRETLMLSKEASDSIKAQLAEKPADKPSSAIPKTIPPAPVKQAAKAKHVTSEASMTQPSAAASSAKTKPLPEPVKTAEIPSPAKPETISEKPVATPSGPTQDVLTSGFREISVPEIMAPEPSGGNLTKFLAGGLALALIVGGLGYYLFRPKPVATAKKEQPKQTQQAPVVPASDPEATNPDPAAVTPTVPAETEEQKQELLKRIEEEKKKIEALKAEALKAEDLKKKEEQQKREEQAKLEEQKKEEARQQEEQRLAEEQKKAEAEKAAEVERAAEEQRKKEEAEAEQTRLAQLQQEQQTPPQPATQDPEPAQEAPQAPVVNEGDLVELTPDVTKPVLTKRVDAEYPPLARQKKIEGTVILQLLVNENGQVADVKVLRRAGGSTGLTESAIAAARQWAFQPAVKAGKRVKVQITYPIHFKLQN